MPWFEPNPKETVRVYVEKEAASDLFVYTSPRAVSRIEGDRVVFKLKGVEAASPV